VDIVVDRERGPLVLEINARPGLEIQNVVGRGLGDALAALRADVEGA
jgi:glutathione synthase/RimK-type ligase-like ATP-grasp enzyme